jgi:hypothetical protein
VHQGVAPRMVARLPDRRSQVLVGEGEWLHPAPRSTGEALRAASVELLVGLEEICSPE